MPLSVFGLPQDFRPYSVTHGVMIVAGLGVTLLLVWLRRRWRGSPRAARLDRTLGVLTLLLWITYKTYVLLPGVFIIDYSLPLQICDMSGLFVPLALLSRRRQFAALLYFWGIGLSSQACISPDLHHGPESLKFWLFWASHVAIVGGAFYVVAGQGFWPGWRDWGIAVAAATVYLMFILPFDIVSGFNYGYLGRSRPDQPAILERLGAWPWRLPVMAALVLLVCFLLLLPWEIARLAREPRHSVRVSDKPPGRPPVAAAAEPGASPGPAAPFTTDIP